MESPDPADYEDIEGATSSTYSLTEKDVGEELTVKVTSTDQFRNGDDTPHKLDLPVARRFPLFTTSRSRSSSWVTWLTGG